MKRALMVLALLLLPAMAAPAGEETTLRGRVTLDTAAGQPRANASDVVVFLENVEGAPASEPRPAEMRQLGKQFSPEVLPVVVGTQVSFPNQDNVYHNVFSRSKTKPFNLGMIKQEDKPSLRFDAPGLVKVYCHIHAHMVGYILVLNNPFFAVTDAQGSFEISGIPPGQYTVRAWQRFGPEETATVQLAQGQTQDLDFHLKEENNLISSP
ncbi:MAG: carboxypeptidase regulatory-like domain-containing protein [Candidatus Omnitrophota bacterium]|nr:carboxypeptidase regulatory-like domain-containing protein [Candidatus Omnitrophota bacterium]